MVGCASASTYQGSTETHLKSACGLCAWGVVRDHLTATFARLLACRTQLPLASACGGALGRLGRSGVLQFWQRWRWFARSHQRLRTLPRLLGLGAREDRLPQRTLSATSASLHLQHHQVTSFEFHFQLGAPPGLLHSEAAWVRPCGMYPFYFMSLAYFVGGAPRAASSPSRSGRTEWHASSLHLPKLGCFPCLIYL